MSPKYNAWGNQQRGGSISEQKIHGLRLHGLGPKPNSARKRDYESLASFFPRRRRDFAVKDHPNHYQMKDSQAFLDFRLTNNSNSWCKNKKMNGLWIRSSTPWIHPIQVQYQFQYSKNFVEMCEITCLIFKLSLGIFTCSDPHPFQTKEE